MSQRLFSRAGFTLVELLVCLAVSSLLMSLILMGVQRSRAAARRIDCVNNLKQIGLANADYAETHGEYPVRFHGRWQLRLYRTMGFPLPDDAPIVPEGFTGFLCPDDGYYEPNDGTRFRGESSYRNGFSGLHEARRPADILDGDSSTAAYSELSPRPRWWIDRHITYEKGAETELIDACRHHRVSTLPEAYSSDKTGYDHFLTPNQAACWATDRPRLHDSSVGGVFPASSNHAGGVNVGFLDGHVTFISDSIDWSTWQNLGTINGGETVGQF